MPQDVLAAITATENSSLFNNLKVLYVKCNGLDLREGERPSGDVVLLAVLCTLSLRIVQQSSDATGSVGCVLVFFYLFLHSGANREPVCCDVDSEDPTMGWWNDIHVAFTLSV